MGRHYGPSLQEHIEQAIRLALENTIQRHDYALAELGARISTELTPHKDNTMAHGTNAPDNVLTEDLHRASCWFFPGGRGQVGIRLAGHLISPTHVALDVLSSPSSYNRAPRKVVVWGIVDGEFNRLTYDVQLRDYRKTVAHLGDGPAQSLGYTFLALAEFEYDPLAAFPLQIHRVAGPVIQSQITFGVIVVEIRSNWRGDMTNLCRVRVHGEK
ncbi:hypothetical protein C8Q78DRAFT_983002 [Trametes maxima]|nr:hypothetical protein C8Q78DRAFT_983002 [Trametes maxima]